MPLAERPVEPSLIRMYGAPPRTRIGSEICVPISCGRGWEWRTRCRSITTGYEAPEAPAMRCASLCTTPVGLGGTPAAIASTIRGSLAATRAIAAARCS